MHDLRNQIETDLKESRWRIEGATLMNELRSPCVKAAALAIQRFVRRLKDSIETRGDAWALYGGYLRLRLEDLGAPVVDECPLSRESRLKRHSPSCHPFAEFVSTLMGLPEEPRALVLGILASDNTPDDHAGSFTNS